MEMIMTTCPVCGGPATIDADDQEGTLYCANANCGFMGVPPEELRST